MLMHYTHEILKPKFINLRSWKTIMYFTQGQEAVIKRRTPEIINFWVRQDLSAYSLWMKYFLSDSFIVVLFLATCNVRWCLLATIESFVLSGFAARSWSFSVTECIFGCSTPPFHLLDFSFLIAFDSLWSSSSTFFSYTFLVAEIWVLFINCRYMEMLGSLYKFSLC